MASLLSNIRSSLFLRLSLIYGLTVALFLITGSIAFRIVFMQNMEEMSGHQYLVRHVQVAIDDIGTPPNLEHASDLAKLLPITIVIHGPDLRWQSDEQDISLERVRVIHSLTDGAIVNTRGDYGIQVNRGEYQFFIFWKRHLLGDESMQVFYIALTVMVAALFLNYWLVRRLLKPIRILKQGAERISNGELDYRVTNIRKDELGDLMISINRMADSLQQMLEAKQQLLLGISHELRSPITRAKVQIESIEDEALKTSLKEDIDELDLLVSELLEAERLNSRHVALNLEPVMFAEFIDQTLLQFWPKQELIQLEKPVEDHIIEIDTLRMTLLLRNLVHNALHYGEGSPVIVKVSKGDLSAQLSVQDSGQGIKQEHIKHLTEPFYRADSARQRETGSFGLGLYLCRLIAEAHQGSIEVISEYGTGTTILVHIPFTRT